MTATLPLEPEAKTDPPGKQPFWTRRRRTTAMAVILTVSAAARLVNLRETPGWYRDECAYVDQSWNLVHGRLQRDAIRHTFLPRLPLMHLLIGPPNALLGKDVIWGRLLTALCGIATTWLIYRIAREMGGKRRALLAAGMFAVSHYVVLQNRWGFSYSLDCVLGAASVFFLQRHVARPGNGRHLWLAALAVALGAMVDPIMFPRIALLCAAAALTAGFRRAAVATAASLAPLAVYTLLMLAFAGDIFVEDVQVILARRIAESPEWLVLGLAFIVYLLKRGFIGVAGLIGLVFFLPVTKARRILVAALALDAVILLKSAGPDVVTLYRTGIVLMPALFIGAAFTAAALCRWLVDNVRAELGAFAVSLAWWARREIRASHRRAMAWTIWTLCGLAVTSALIVYASPTSLGVSVAFLDNYQGACILNVEDADAAADWANARLNENDLVMTTHVGFMYNCRTTTPMVVYLVEGGPGDATIFPELLDRLVYPSALSDVRLAVLHEAIPALARILEFEPLIRRVVLTWPMIHAEGSFRFYANPDFPDLPKPGVGKAEGR